ncbi:hypothetical protein NDU88_008212 [Pleurodeles waltl]|uniref:Uncharacterized protein n=1 Tax=Pleurodeles waltl TaxID=8319 RepID=A0AAV7VUD9_PLEWA|nr:hypothetical protein NDU88_008212 [Pleurodeles waltl]
MGRAPGGLGLRGRSPPPRVVASLGLRPARGVGPTIPLERTPESAERRLSGDQEKHGNAGGRESWNPIPPPSDVAGHCRRGKGQAAPGGDYWQAGRRRWARWPDGAPVTQGVAALLRKPGGHILRRTAAGIA